MAAEAPDLQVISSDLFEKRRELAGELDQAQAVIDRIKSEIGAIDTVLRLFGAGDQRHKSVLPLYRRNTSKLVLTVLRESPRPLTAIELARIVLAEQKANLRDKELVLAVTRRVRSTLQHFKKRGVLAAVESADRSHAWHFADSAPWGKADPGEACRR